MFWGKGDTSQLTDDERVTLSHLRRMTETGHLKALNAKESDMLLRALEWYSDWEGTFRTLRHVRNVIGLLSFFFVSWWATGGAPIDAIMELLK